MATEASHGEETENIPDFTGLLRPGDCRTDDESGDSNLFHQGAANESDDPDVAAATIKKPGVVLRRPVGSNGSFNEHAKLPTNIGCSGKPTKADRKPKGRKAKKTSSSPVDKAAERKAALTYEWEQKRSERERARGDAARKK